jgi:hypothetical protein
MLPKVEPVPETPASLLQRLRLPGETGAWARFVELYSPLLWHWAGDATIN